MSCEQITKYFDATESRKVRDDLVFSANIVSEPKSAIDCGCGAGADIAYLAEIGFTVHGFDVEQESISRCQSRFSGLDNVFLTKSSFTDFEYPPVSLVVADASLFFCPSSEFRDVWSKIYQCLLPGGIFCGSFLGQEDTMAIPGDNPSVFWPEVTAFEEGEVKELFNNLEVLRFNTHRSTGKTPQGVTHNWHIFQVVAQKPNK
ncbi:MAG TPA: class I SAM-dependent methyltransferase [Methylophaga sp.]|mgnify:CR=1 FL=1|jgi:SAM-dependent methyltransferase|uniref:class I SAM-dependent methyltransferase n=1 Tax=unclassified Methylophaga TaxID=2629249 RepID=UPI000C8A7C7A|nr:MULTISPECIES: class I SAM-dependent methyltransferase [unclassified Methylophaga]MAP25531.1 tellurite resistance protein [Methylophaga sp.]HAD32069.1 class I SAM-dependent methyltransferase [Methylophaga sp.]HCO01327.1 class I SAM-dependent methyltransferase [Methylophaga sp.]|tara:strand:- start:3055 stop:3663 length:609 start_codon:yes stop_codon:yes gene_type:complete